MTGTELREWREARGLSQGRLARALGVPQGTLSRWETGARPIQHDRMLALALRTKYRAVQVV